MVKQCLFYWNGREADGGGDFTLQPGIRPSTAVLRMRMSYTHAQYGTLTLSDGNRSIHFNECRLHRMITTTQTDEGRWRELTIFDQRWQWEDRYSACYGEYNGASPKFRKEKSARDLAVICLQSLGVQKYNVNALPTATPGPYVNWDGSDPAVALDNLCQLFGCIVTLDTRDTVVIHKVGIGRKPSRDPRLMDYQTNGSPPVIPRNVFFEGGHCFIQHDLPLVACGREISGSLAGNFVPINDLSYKPEGGWEATSPGAQGFNSVNPDDSDDKARAITEAREHVFRTYIVGGRIQTDSRDEYEDIKLPVLPELVVKNTNSSGRSNLRQRTALTRFFTIKEGESWRIELDEEQLPAWVRDSSDVATLGGGDPYEILGYYHLGGVASRNTLNAEDFNDIESTTPNAFKFDKPLANVPLPADSRLTVKLPHVYEPAFNRIKFNNYVYFNVSGQPYPAVLRLRVKFRLRDPDSAAFLAPQYRLKTGGPISTNITKLLKDSDISVDYGLYGSASNPRVDSNAPAFVNTAIARIAQETSQYTFPQGASLPYKGFTFDIVPDGIVRAVSFSVSQGQGRTFVDYGLERPDSYLTLNELRMSRMITFNEWLQREIERKKNRRAQ